MADPVVGSISSAIVRVTVQKASSFVAKEFLAFYHVKEDIEKLRTMLPEIVARVEYVEGCLFTSSRHLMLKNWLEKLIVATYDAQDLMASWAAEYHMWKMKKQVQKLHLPFAATSFLYQYRKSCELRELVERLERILQEGRQDDQMNRGLSMRRDEPRNSPKETGSLSNKLVVGRENDVENIIKLLIPGEETSDGGDISVIPILGMGGVGKTTLAQLVKNDDRVSGYFQTKIWVSVNDTFDLNRIFKQIIAEETKLDTNLLYPDQLQKRVVDILVNKDGRFLLVLDDIWNHNYMDWQPLEDIIRRGHKGSRVLVTSRITQVSRIMGARAPYCLQCFDNNESWSLFEKIVFEENGFTDGERAEFEAYGREIVSKCKGLPLAVKQMGGLLRGESELQNWKNIMQSEIWELENDSILPALRLSYNQLSSDLKQCFAYCSLFPKAYTFDKNELIKLWMAEEFLQTKRKEKTEDIGSRYFNDLVMRFFFESSSNVSDDSSRYTMHDLIHDLAKSVSRSFYSQVQDKDASSLQMSLRHVSLLCKDVEQPTSDIINKSKKLRTLLFPVEHMKDFVSAQQMILNSLQYIRVLDLSSSTLQILPRSIENLKLLRYLNLSRTEIKKLPNSVCRLYNLETLKLLGCPWLFKLPQNLSDLTNLRYLELDEMFWFKVSRLPPKMGRLTNLHTLHVFLVGQSTGYRLEELKNMVYLTGTLRMSKLENAVDAVDAKLKDKERIQKVVYEWSKVNVNMQHNADEEKVLEELQPHANVKEIGIFHYTGNELPTWMGNGQLQNLVTVSLKHCTYSKILCLGNQPNLKNVRLKNMKQLEEWQGEYPSMINLKISDCPKLTKLPHSFPMLGVLKIEKCDLLDTIPLAPRIHFMTLVDNAVLKHWSEGIIVNQLPELLRLPEDLHPQKLEISGCMSLSALPDDKHAVRLQHLALDACSDDTLLKMIPKSETLYSLVISKISNVRFLPRWPSLPNLKTLYIRDWEDLESLSNQGNTLVHAFTSLQLLSIRNCPKLLDLPQEGLPTTLQYLSIGSCATLQSFGPSADVLKKLTSLSDIYIEDCPALQSLPEDGLPDSLQHLSIHGCDSLEEHCRKGDGDLPKITHVPDVEMDPVSSNNASSSSSSSPLASCYSHLKMPCGSEVTLLREVCGYLHCKPSGDTTPPTRDT
ncbi:hypothetical protein FNV43_RR06957 [Rhamnella rubrinervis]|uniref:Uncharacterized protein n=1 Tax=Rhamnella rubrinervis TaxID=2594499 RepID=A0A8K0HFM0_9ROSA|nr:hypothetical protein FNV43_RR06957 [Rhamnella rubrinervis]